MADDNVKPLFAQMQPSEEERRLQPSYLQAVNAALDMASARVLGLLAVLGAIAMFGVAIYDPTPWRVYAAGGYAVVVMWPVIWLYLKKA